MKNRIRAFAFIGAGLLLTALTSCERVAPNYIGVLMENYGKSGKSDFSTTKGRVNVLSPGSELFQVPLWEQRATFEDAVKLQASDQTAFNSKPNYTYSVIESRAVDVVFQNKQLNGGEKFMKALEDNILETKIYDIMKEESRKYLTDTLMARGGSLKFEKHVEALVTKAFLSKGLKLENFTAQLEFSESVTKKIDNRNEVNTNISVIDQKINEQRKKNELAELVTQEQLIISRGITPELLQQQALVKWNGVLPSTFAGGALPFVKNVR